MSQETVQSITSAPSPREALVASGATFKTSNSTRNNSININGITLGEKESHSTVHIWTLPNVSPIKASFSKEGVKDKLVKLFTGEVQVGDPLFDDLVYISTGTKEQTAAMLKSESLQSAIMVFVGSGGEVEVSGSTVKVSMSDPLDERPTIPEREEAVIIAHMMGMSLT